MAEAPEDDIPTQQAAGRSPTLRELDQVPGVAPIWYRLGLQLGVRIYDLDVIEKNYPRDADICKIKMFAEWQRSDTNPTYEKLVRALSAVGKRKLAESVCSAQGISPSVLDATDAVKMLKCHVVLNKVLRSSFKHTNLDAIESFRKDLAGKYSFPDFIIFLKEIKKGCVATVRLVPPSLAAKLEDEIKRGNVSFLEQHNVLELKIQESVVYYAKSAQNTAGIHSGHSQSEGSVLEINFSDLEFGEQLGEGASGVIYRGHWKSRDMDVAIKRVSGKLNETEIQILDQLRHPCIIRFHGVVVDSPGPSEHYIITELAEGGSLYDQLHKKKYQPTQEERLRWAAQIAQGMKYLHEEKLMHRDLISSNVLLTGEGNIKICNFGGAKYFDRTTKQTQIGTYRWMAPEVMKGEPVSLSSDVFSYGMLLYEILTGELPFADAKTDVVVSSKIMSGEVPPIPVDMKSYLAETLKQCWNADPKARPSFYDILECLTKRVAAKRTCEDNEKPTTSNVDDTSKKIEGLLTQRTTPLFAPSTAECQLLDPQCKPKWGMGTDLPVAMSRPHLVKIKNNIYCGGGITGKKDTERLVFKYDPMEDSWAPLPPCPTRHYGLSEFHNCLVSVGGVMHNGPDRIPKNSVYTFQDPNWVASLPPMPTARFQLSVFTHNNHLIACGGVTRWTSLQQYTCTSAVEVLSSETGQWSTLTPLPFPLRLMSPAISNGRCYLIGGDCQEGVPNTAYSASLPILLASAFYPSPSSAVWEVLPNCPLYASTAAELGGCILVLGGTNQAMISSTDVYLYSRKSQSWRITAINLPIASFCATSATLAGDSIVVVGGKAKLIKSRLNKVFVISL